MQNAVCQNSKSGNGMQNACLSPSHHSSFIFCIVDSILFGMLVSNISILLLLFGFYFKFNILLLIFCEKLWK